MLQCNNLFAGYGHQFSLQDISATFPAGKLSILAGVNGCGKSTLLKALWGGLPLQQGEVLLEGKSLTSYSPNLRAKKIAYLPQGQSIPQMTLEQLVLHGRFPHAGLFGNYSSKDREKANLAIRQMSLADIAHRKLGELSGGQRQKAYLAMAIAREAPILLLDEPNSFLDLRHQLELMELLRELTASGKTVIAVLHDLALALQYGEHLVLLQQGRKVYEGKPRGLLEGETLTMAMGVSAVDCASPEGERWIQFKLPK